ncbi:MAG: hypothetical protein L0Y38_02325 [Methylococcaceae bacterium]|nr:hypothetical protein [Methylococcaceae bacterium]MCI0732642.1 hypothetical protein [Methylococcaceae bacterium]
MILASGDRIAGRATWLAALLVLSAIAAGVSHAEQESPANQALRKAQGLLRQLASEKKALQEKNSELEAELAKTKTEISINQQQIQQQQSLNAALKENNAVLVERIESDHGKIQDIIAQYRALQEQLSLYQQDHALLGNAVVEREKWISECRKKNDSLIMAGKDLLVRYNHKSVWDSIVESEPVSGLGKVNVEIENQEYRFKLEDLQVQPPDHDGSPVFIKPSR